MQIEEVRSLIVDDDIPRVRFLLCSNGASWKVPEAQAIIDREQFGDRAVFDHVNHDTLVRILQSTTPVKDGIQFTGKAIIEDFNYARVFLGKVPVSELARLMDTHGDRLLERNTGRYLGLHGNLVNEAIARTLRDPAECSHFYLYNNGITLICDRLHYNTLQPEHYKVRVEGLQIINGGQTSKTLWAAERCLHREGSEDLAAWVAERVRDLSGSGGADQVITTLSAAYAAIPKTGPGNQGKREKVLEVLEHLSKHRHRMPYHDLRRDDLDIATGAGEGAVRNLVRMRLDGPGMRWSRGRSEYVLHLRCILLNG